MSSAGNVQLAPGNLEQTTLTKGEMNTTKKQLQVIFQGIIRQLYGQRVYDHKTILENTPVLVRFLGANFLWICASSNLKLDKISRDALYQLTFQTSTAPEQT